MGRKKLPTLDNFLTSATMNDLTFRSYFNRLFEIAISVFEWKNLPDTMDSRFLEVGLFENGSMLFFFDEELQKHLSLRALLGGQMDVYNNPTQRTAYASNGYQYRCDANNSVIVWSNMARLPLYPDIYQYAMRLAEIDRTIDINVKAQKTPVLIQCDENERLTMLNLYKEYDGNSPVIFGDRSLRQDGLTVLKTDAPFLASELFQLKQNIWNEALTRIGVPNVSYQKKERMVTDEVQRGMGGTLASRFSPLHARQLACEQYNRMKGTNIECAFRADLDTAFGDMNSTLLGGDLDE